MTDADIIELFQKRDERALAETEKRYGKYCIAIARNILHNEQDAEECVNDTYMKAWERIPPDCPRFFGGYLAKIARSLALMRYRCETAQKRGGNTVTLVFDELSEIVSDKADVEQTAENAEILELINRFLGTLSETNRRIFVLRYVCCESVKDIASRFGMSENNVSVTLNRVKKQLKKYLSKEGYEL